MTQSSDARILELSEHINQQVQEALRLQVEFSQMIRHFMETVEIQVETVEILVTRIQRLENHVFAQQELTK